MVRDGEALRRSGVSAELFDDHSPLQLGASGTRQGLAFTLVGRLQYGYQAGPRAAASPSPPPGGAAGLPGEAGSGLDGTWNEWHALFDNGRSAWLSEDNGAYVIAFDAPLPAEAPQDAAALTALRAGQRVLADGRAWDVASTVHAKLIAAQGELPAPPRLQGDFTVVDLRNSAGEVATLDASDPAQLHWSVGRSVSLSELRMSGLKDGATEKTLASRSVECPSCGAALQPTLAATQSLSCGQCKAVVDISQGVGGELAYYGQNNAGATGAEPQIALGSTGTLALGGTPLPWQVVGYQERCDIPDSSEEETSFWREYLLYNTTAGFAFLVDSNDGWSWVKPITGAPAVRGEQAEWMGVKYQQRWRYAAKVTWVQGEFYWRVKQGERALVTDYEGTGSDSSPRLSREQTGTEVTWSAGETLDAAQVASAFAVAPGAAVALQRDVAPFTAKSGGSRNAIIVFVVIVILFALLSRCDRDDCDSVRQSFGAASTEYQQCARQRATSGVPRTGGGSFGGYSSGGGGHK